MRRDLRNAEDARLRLFLRKTTKGDTAKIALRAGFAAASLLGVVTTFGTPLWIVAVLMLVGLGVALVTLERRPTAETSQEQ